MDRYRYCDTTRADGVYVTWKRMHIDDPDGRPHDNELIGKERLSEWRAGLWHYVGIMAKASIEIVQNGTATSYDITSPGVWGIESDSGESYFEMVYEEQKAQLEDDLKIIAKFFVGDGS